MTNSISVADLDVFVQRNPNDYVDTSCDPFIPEVFGRWYGVYNPREATTEYVLTCLCINLLIEAIGLSLLLWW